MKNQDLLVTADERMELALMLKRKYASLIERRYFEVDLKKDGSGIYAKVILRNESGDFFYPVEARIAHGDHTMSARDAGIFLVDSIDSYFEEYLRDGDVFLPIDWSDYELDGIVFQMKGQILNLEAERLADELLSAVDGGGPMVH